MFKPAYGTDGTNDLWADTGKMQWFNEPEQWEVKIMYCPCPLLRKVITGVFLTTVLQ